jgi:hypothetical protein
LVLKCWPNHNEQDLTPKTSLFILLKPTYETIFCFAFHSYTLSYAQNANTTYFEKIRNNEAQLTAFFAQMPKGGDLSF